MSQLTSTMLITGAGSGFGGGTALGLAEVGYGRRTAPWPRRPPPLLSISRSDAGGLKKSGGHRIS
jgi:NAD(P)-dependent dehydrogenase (short-subunit alcohol dehydrogenase family)